MNGAFVPPVHGHAAGYGSTRGGQWQKAASVQKAPPELILLDDSPARRRMNTPAIGQAVLLPCGIYIGCSWVTCFWVRYNHPEAVVFLLVCGLLVGCFLGCKAFLGQSARRGDAGEREPTWLLFLAAACLVAWVAGVVVGFLNFGSNMRSYYDLSILDVVHEVDPRDIPGSHFLDAGGVFFKEGSFVRENYTMGFKDRDLYCVAPIVFGNQSIPLASYDYWAVGMNCCDPMPPAIFSCGAPTYDAEAHAGLRWMGVGERGKFRLAIQQAQEEYSIFAGHPIFFTWTRDPVADTEVLKAQGRKMFFNGVIAHAVLQSIVVAGMVHIYSGKLAAGLP